MRHEQNDMEQAQALANSLHKEFAAMVREIRASDAEAADEFKAFTTSVRQGPRVPETGERIPIIHVSFVMDGNTVECDVPGCCRSHAMAGITHALFLRLTRMMGVGIVVIDLMDDAPDPSAN